MGGDGAPRAMGKEVEKWRLSVLRLMRNIELYNPG